MENLHIDRDGPVAVMVWHHEEQNRFTTTFVREILAALDELERDERVRGVVVASAIEKHWSQGIFLQWMMAEGANGPAGIEEFLHELLRLLITATAYPKPIVAAINGHVAGGGTILAAAMDYRLMNADRGFVRLPEVHVAIPFWPGMMALLKDVIPAPGLRDFVYTGKPFTGVQAKAMGFIDELCPRERLVPRAVELVKELAGGDLETYKIIKREMRRGTLAMMEREDPPTIAVLIDKLTKAHG
jgi:enoyl-CoA hydratase/carnithine racemase